MPQFKSQSSSAQPTLWSREDSTSQPVIGWDTGVSPLETLKSLSGFSRFFLFPVVTMQMSFC